jgi:hypothetical protein
MKYTSSLAERTFLAVNRLIAATMTSAWITTLRHQHVLAPPQQDHDADEIGSLQKRPPATDDQVLH